MVNTVGTVGPGGRRRRQVSRRTILSWGVLGGGLTVVGCANDNASDAPTSAATSGDPTSAGAGSGSPADAVPQWRMPDEGERHQRTWMAFGASEQIWGADLLPTVRKNLADIARAIAGFEPVSMLVRSSDRSVATKLGGGELTLVDGELDDLWMRDTGPVFVQNGDKLAAVDFNFNGWGDHQEHARDARVAGFVADQADAPLLHTELVLEGGALEVDGHGTAIVTESCVLNANRNPGWTKSQVEQELNRLLGLRKIIWLPGIAGKDITDGHTDFYARFTEPGIVVAGLDPDPASYDYAVTRQHLSILKKATGADGQRLQVHTITGPETIRPEDSAESFAAGYINFYVCNGGVIAPQFGDRRADAAALATLEQLFPDRKVVQVDIDGIAAGGGGIHCTTQQQPSGSA